MHCIRMRFLCMIGILCTVNFASGEQPEIVIIGAGAAGIAAASKLYENGFQNITILEAEDRIGGRVYTTWFDESWIDLGGQTVHGDMYNVVFDLVSPLGLLDIPEMSEDPDFIVYTSKGVQIPTSISSSLFETFYNVSIREVVVNENNSSVGDYLTRMINIELAKHPIVNETLTREFMKLLEGFSMSSDASDNWYETSVRGYQDSWESSENLTINWKDRGYGTVFDILVKKYPNPKDELPVLNNTCLNSEVTKINYHSTDGKVLVETSNGKQYTADHVIMTASLGVLKEQYGTLFTPELPEAKQRTIKGLGFGTLGKIYLSFEDPWWPEDSSDFAFIWDEDDRQEYGNDPDRKWLLDLMTVTSVAHRPRLLCAWTSGESARYMETLSDDQVLNQTLALLNKFLGKTYNITRPTTFIHSRWYSNKHFRGSYSLRTMETERADASADQLAVPLLVNGKPVVMFAGEATNAHRYGTVDGAVASGFREANRLIAMYTNVAE